MVREKERTQPGKGVRHFVGVKIVVKLNAIRDQKGNLGNSAGRNEGGAKLPKLVRWRAKTTTEWCFFGKPLPGSQRNLRRKGVYTTGEPIPVTKGWTHEGASTGRCNWETAKERGGSAGDIEVTISYQPGGMSKGTLLANTSEEGCGDGKLEG